MGTKVEVLIVGGGVIGLSLAYALAKEGVKATVVDQGEIGKEASWAGAGMLPSPRGRSPLANLCRLSNNLHPTWAAELREATSIDNGYRRCGGLDVRYVPLLGGTPPSSANAQRSVPPAASHCLRSTLSSGTAPQPQFLTQPDLAQLEPALTLELPGAIFYPDAAQLRNPRHLQALQAACVKLGCQLIPNEPVREMVRTGERITEVASSGRRWQPGQVVLTAGAWTNELLKPLGVGLGIKPIRGQSLGIKPIRGQIVLLRNERPLFHRLLMAGPKYLVPRDDGRVLVGSTEEDVGFVKENTAEAVATLKEFAFHLVPTLRQAAVERTWAGLRPGNVDRKPYLGGIPGTTNLFVAAGHFRSGLQLAPITAMLMKQVLLGQPLTCDLTPFRVDRAK